MDISRAEIERRAAEKSRENRSSGWLLILLGLPLALVTIFFMTGALWFLLIFLPFGWSWGVCYLIALSVVLLAVLVDTLLHPSENWVKARFYLVGGETSGAEFGDYLTEHEFKGGAFSGMPLMTDMTDPRNWAMRGKLISSGFTNVVLGGPRNIRRGIEELRLAKARQNPKGIAAATEVLNWIESKGEVSEDDIRGMLSANGRLFPGYALAGELGFLARRMGAAGKVIVLRKSG